MSNTALEPRKRPLQARGMATWDAIIEAAAQILEVNGLHGFNTNAVAERAGVSIGSLYQYFPNKDALMVGLIEREQKVRMEGLTQVIEAVRDEPLEIAVAALIDASVNSDAGKPRLAISLDHEEARLPVELLLNRTATMLDDAFAKLLANYFPNVSSEALSIMARTSRVLARAAIDEYLGVWTSDPDHARSEAKLGVMGYLERKMGVSDELR